MLILLDPKNGFITKDELETLNKCVKTIKFPHDFKEKVTEVTIDSIRKAKATEQQLLFLHVLYPLLEAHIPEYHFIHIGLLVTAIQILNQDSCTLTEIEKAKSMLECYHRLNGDLYERCHSTYTNHALVHLPKQRKLHGCPLVLMSNFVFEGLVGIIFICAHLSITLRKYNALIFLYFIEKEFKIVPLSLF